MTGRNYDTHEWIEFLFEGKDPETDAEQAVTNVIQKSMEYLIDSCWRTFQVKTWGEQVHVDRHDNIDWHYMCYLAHQSVAGAGTGLWDAEKHFEQWLGAAACVGDRDTQPSALFDQFIIYSQAPCAVAFRVFSEDLDERIGLPQEEGA